MAGGVLGVVALSRLDTSPSRPHAPDGRLVVEEEVGFFGRLLGREPRLFITLPAETLLCVEIPVWMGVIVTLAGEVLLATGAGSGRRES